MEILILAIVVVALISMSVSKKHHNSDHKGKKDHKDKGDFDDKGKGGERK